MEIRIDGSEIDVFALIRGLIIALGIMLIILAIIRYRKKTQNADQPMESAQATVVDRQPVGTVPTAYGIWIVFDLADGRRIKLYDKTSTDLIVGDTGQLSWQGDSVVYFSRGKKQDSTGQQPLRTSAIRQQKKTWICPTCGCENAGSWDACAGCGEKRPES